MGVGGQHHALAAFSRERDPVPIVQEAVWVPGPVWTVAENVAAHQDSIPYRSARSETLYRVGYPGPPGSMYHH